MSECLACDLACGAVPLPGGLILQTPGWRVEHCVGPLGVGTLVVKPKRHVLRVADLTEREAAEMGPLLVSVAAAVDELTGASQVTSACGRTDRCTSTGSSNPSRPSPPPAAGAPRPRPAGRHVLAGRLGRSGCRRRVRRAGPQVVWPPRRPMTRAAALRGGCERPPGARARSCVPLAALQARQVDTLGDEGRAQAIARDSVGLDGRKAAGEAPTPRPYPARAAGRRSARARSSARRRSR